MTKLITSPVWLTEDIKYKWEDGWQVVELHEPWDLMLEGTLLKHGVGSELHVFMVGLREERVFSIRDSFEAPRATMTTMPKGARDWWSFAPIRGLFCSAPMTVDDQELNVIEVIQKDNFLTPRHSPLFNRAIDFYKAMGGEVNYDLPSGNLLSGTDLQRWRRFFKDQEPRSIAIANSDKNYEIIQGTNPHLIVFNLDEAKMALRYGKWGNLYMPRDWQDRKALTDYMTKFKLRPGNVYAYRPKEEEQSDIGTRQEVVSAT